MGRYFFPCPHCRETINLHDTEIEPFLDEEYQRGYTQYGYDTKIVLDAQHKIETMQSLLDANARVLRRQIRQDLIDEMFPERKDG